MNELRNREIPLPIRISAVIIFCIVGPFLWGAQAFGSDTEANAIIDAIPDMTDELPPFEVFLDGADEVYELWYESTSPECARFADIVHSLLLLGGFSVETGIGLDSTDILFDAAEGAEYACRISL